jgi:tRNA(Arg) A34 adenosine deaminase TadA
MPNPDHERFLRRAIELAARADLEFGTGAPYGAVIVKDNKIVAEGMNQVLASPDRLSHWKAT